MGQISPALVISDFERSTTINLPENLTGFTESETQEQVEELLEKLCYQYKYDHRNRLVEKKIPGKGWESIVYDNLDRPVLTQDAVQKTQQKWNFTKYDNLGRVVYTGIYTHDLEKSQAQMQSHFNALNATAQELYETKVSTGTGFDGTYYTNSNFPDHNLEVLTVNYYDDYTFNRAGAPTTVNVYGVNSTTNLKSLATGSRIKVLDQSPQKWMTTVTYYDEKARPIYTYSHNAYLLSTDIVKSKLDFVGKVLETTTTHTKTDDNLPTLTLIDKFEYDHVGRLEKQTQKVEGELQPEEEIVYNTYDELGQLQSKGVGGKTTQSRLQTVDYTYNIRGWLTNINQDTQNDNDLFNFTLRYNNPTTGTALYNGNISQTSWNTLNIDSSSKTYTYAYDALNRIKNAIDNTSDTRYSLLNVAYDKNGNIKSLQRKGHTTMNAQGVVTSYGVMDNLIYTYDQGNKLLKVEDTAAIDEFGFKDDAINNEQDTSDDYVYDANGNMTKDDNKQITSIIYNHLNLPTKVTIQGKEIKYIYDATGLKLSKEVERDLEHEITQYAGNFIYKSIDEDNEEPNFELQFFNHAEGYVKNDNGIFSYIYQYKDHLGNVRLSYSDTNNDGEITASSDPSTNEIIEESNYYPFGLQHKGYNNTISSNGNSVAQKFGYNGKELNEELGLEWHDFGARNYDASLGRWMNIDPLSELKYEFTPYNYVQNSPMYRIDPDGLTDYTLNKKTGAVTEVEGTKTEDGIDRIVKTNRKGEIKTYKSGKKKGQSKVAIGGIEQGILKDGQNLKTDDTVIATGGDGQPTEDGVKSFALNLSEYIGKEIKGFSYSSNGSGDVTDMVLGKYMNNDYTTSYGTTNELSNKYGADFSLNNVVQQFHTHPDGKLGATQTAPGQSGDVKNLQKDKPFIPNASFIVLYRIVNQKSPGEYNYTHEYKGKKKR